LDWDSNLNISLLPGLEAKKVEKHCSRVMTWQPHYSGHALPPPPKGRDVSEDTQVELVYFEHWGEQVEFKAILFLCHSCYFQPFDFIKNKRTSSKLLFLCIVILNQV